MVKKNKITNIEEREIDRIVEGINDGFIKPLKKLPNKVSHIGDRLSDIITATVNDINKGLIPNIVSVVDVIDETVGNIINTPIDTTVGNLDEIIGSALDDRIAYLTKANLGRELAQHRAEGTVDTSVPIGTPAVGLGANLDMNSVIFNLSSVFGNISNTIMSIASNFNTMILGPLSNVINTVKTKTIKGLKEARKFLQEGANAALGMAAMRMIMQSLQPVIEALLFPLILLEPIMLVIAMIIMQMWMPLFLLLVPMMVWLIDIMIEHKEIVMIVIIAIMLLVGGPMVLLIGIILAITFIISHWNEIVDFLTKNIIFLLSPMLALIWLIDWIIKLFYGGSPGLLPAFELFALLLKIVINLFYMGVFVVLNMFTLYLNGLIVIFNTAGSIVKSVTGHVDSLISSISNILSLGIGGGGGGSSSSSKKKKKKNLFDPTTWFAGGGYIDRPTIVGVGEDEGEFIFTKRQTAALAGMGIGGNKGEQEPIVVNINGGVITKDFDELAEIIGRKLRLLRG